MRNQCLPGFWLCKTSLQHGSRNTGPLRPVFSCWIHAVNVFTLKPGWGWELQFFLLSCWFYAGNVFILLLGRGLSTPQPKHYNCTLQNSFNAFPPPLLPPALFRFLLDSCSQRVYLETGVGLRTPIISAILLDLCRLCNYLETGVG